MENSSENFSETCKYRKSRRENEKKQGALKKLLLTSLIINFFILAKSIPTLHCPFESQKKTERDFFCGRRANINCIPREGTYNLIDIAVGRKLGQKLKALIEKEEATENSIIEIEGVGPKTLEKIKKYFVVEPCM